MTTPPTFLVSERFTRAAALAIELHRDQGRKRDPGRAGPPYIGHVFGVAGLVLEDGGSEDQAIAALLHDAIEDRPRRGLRDQIAAEFGESVLAIVEAVSQEQKSAEQRADRDLARDSWRERRQRYIAHLEDADPSVLRVSLADKLWNLGSILRDYDDVGHAVWNRFNADAHDQLWYYEELAQRYGGRIESAMVCELSRAVDRLRAIVEGERTV